MVPLHDVDILHIGGYAWMLGGKGEEEKIEGKGRE